MESIRELRKICQAQMKAIDSLHVKFIRRFSIYISRLLLSTPITANQVTLIFIFLGLISGIFFCSTNVYSYLIGVIVLQIWFIFDCIDGEIARYRKTATITGMYLDRISHAIVHPYIFACISIGVFLKMQNIWIFFFGFSSSLSILLNQLVRALRYSINFEVSNFSLPSNYFSSQPESPIKVISSNNFGNKGFLQSFIRIIVNYPGIMNILSLIVILDLLVKKGTIPSFKFSFVFIFLVFYGLFLPYFWIKTIYNTLKRSRN